MLGEAAPGQIDNFALGYVTTLAGPLVTFDEDLLETPSAIPILDSYLPALGDRVLLGKVNRAWVIIGAVRTAPVTEYYEEYTLATATGGTGVSITTKGSGSPTKLFGVSAYNTSTGAFTAPVDGIYSISYRPSFSFGGSGATRTLIGLSTGAALGGTLIARDDLGTTRAAATLTFNGWLAAGATIYGGAQVAGGAATITAVGGFISFTLVRAT